MATGVVIRLQSLPLTAGTIDIRRFFSGLSVPDGGVHIIGGEDGTAFILFTTDEDARQAMMRDGEMLFTEKIKLRLSSHTEMRKLIEDSQRRYEELRGLRPPEPPITNLSSRSTATGRVQPTSPKPTTQEYSESSDLFVELKNLPYTITEEDVVYFFAPLPISAIRIMRDDKGSGFVKFKTVMDRMEALKRDRNTIGPRYIRVFATTERMWLLTGTQPSGQDLNRKRPQGGTPTNDGTPKRSRALSPLRYDNCVELRGLPHTANYKTILDFFHHFQIAEEGVFVELDGKLCKGHAYIEFMTDHDYKAALLRDGEIIEGKQIRVIGISRQAMMEQIKLFKKYIKVKREEEIRREFEERQQNEMKMVEDERKRKHEEEMARKRLKKQREMEEWLSRQHAKEEEERKRLELEKRILAQEKSREQEKIRKERQIEAERQKMDAAAKLQQQKDQMKKKDQSMPMDLEDEENPPSKIVTSSQYSSPQDATFRNQSIPSTAMERINPISTGSSGSHIVPPQYMATPPLPMQPFPPRFSPSGPRESVLPPPPHFPGMRQPLPPTLGPIGLTPPPALPPPSSIMVGVNPPPPLPQLPPPPIAPFENGHGQEKKPNGSSFPIPTSTGDSEFATYVRVANSPWHVGDDEVKTFFAGMRIAPGGIKYVDNKFGKRSGHIFVKFSTVEDAQKAVLLDKTKFGYREVLVQKTHLHQMEEIVMKCSNSSIESILGFKPNRSYQPPAPHLSVDKAFEQKIIRDKLTCIRLSDVPENVTVENVLDMMRGISIVPGGIQILRDNLGKCVGEIFIELVTPQDCARASSFHEPKKLLGRDIKIIPVSLNDMKKDLNLHFEKLRPDVMRTSPRMMMDGPRPPFPDFSRNPPPLPNSSFPDIRPPMDSLRRDMRDEMHLRMPMDLRKSPTLSVDMMRDRLPPFPDRMPRDFPRFPDPGMQRPSMPNDRMFPRGPSGPGPWDGPMRHPIHPGFPFDSRGMPPIRHLQPVPIKMGNLSFNIKPDEILDFFNRYNPIPQSIEFFHHKDGKLNGNGVVFVPGIEAAEAAINDLNGKVLLQRKIRLQIG